MRRHSRLFSNKSFERADALMGTLRQIAVAHGVTPSQIALAWAIREPCVVAIPGAATVAQMEANAEAADLDLAADEIAALDLTSAAYAGAAASYAARAPLFRRPSESGSSVPVVSNDETATPRTSQS